MANYAIGQSFLNANEVIVRACENPIGTRRYAAVNETTRAITVPAGLTYVPFEGVSNGNIRINDTDTEFRLLGDDGWGDSKITNRGMTSSLTTYFMLDKQVVGDTVTLLPDYDPSFEMLQKARYDRVFEIYFEYLKPLGSDSTPVTGTIPVGTTLTLTTAGVGYANGIYKDVALTTLTGVGTGARADVVVVGGEVVIAKITAKGSGYANGDTLRAPTASVGGGSPGTLMTLTIPNATVASTTATYYYDFCGFNSRLLNYSENANPQGMLEVTLELKSRGAAVFGKYTSGTQITAQDPNP